MNRQRYHRLTPIGSVFLPRQEIAGVAAPPIPAVLEPMGEGQDLPPKPSPTKADAVIRLAHLFGEVDAAAVQYSLEVGQDAAHAILGRLFKAGRLTRISNGLYTLPGTT